MTRKSVVIFVFLFGAILTGQTLLTSVPIPTSSAENLFLASSPDGNEVYAATSGFITVVDAASRTIKSYIKISYPPSGICANSQGLVAVVTNGFYQSGHSRVSLVNTKTGTEDAVFDPGIPMSDNGCSFSPDNPNRLWVVNSLFVSVNLPKVSLIDTTDTKNPQVIRTWNTGFLYHTAIQAVSKDKAYALASTPSGGGNVEILRVDQENPTILDVGGDPRAIALGPNGWAYVTIYTTTGWMIVSIDTATDKIVNKFPGVTFHFAFPSQDPWFCYVTTPAGFFAVNTFQGYGLQIVSDGKQRYGIAAKRLSDGTDKVFDQVVVMRQDSLDFYTVTQPTMIYAVTNCADYKVGPTAPGTCMTVWGHNLASTTKAASSVEQLPTTLENTQVLVNGQPAPLYFVSPGQINFQVPTDITGESASFSVRNGQTTSNSVKLALQASAPAQFTGPNGETLLSSATGLWSTPKNEAGQVALIYAVGLGTVNPSLKSGQPASMSQLTNVNNPVVVKLCGEVVVPFFSGAAPGWIGLYQLNLWIPAACAGNPTAAVVEAAK